MHEFPNTVLFTLLLPDWKIARGKKLSVSLLDHFMGRQIFWINTENALKRGYLFSCILRAIFIETSGSTLKKNCSLMRNLNYSLVWKAVRNVCSHKKKKCSWMFANFPSRQTNININFWVLVEGWSTLVFWAGVSNLTQEPLAFTIPCSAAAILLP